MAWPTRVPLIAIIREIWPFVLTLAVLLAILTYFPSITLFLPRLWLSMILPRRAEAARPS